MTSPITLTSTLTPAQKPRRAYEVRYSGDFAGNSLYSRHIEYEDALNAKRRAGETARAAGNARLANSFEVS